MAWVRPALAPAPEPALDAALARAFHGPTVRLSVSQLEKFAACPLEYFLHYTLSLRERPLLELDVLNLGTLYHRILERVYDRIIGGELPWPDCTEAALCAVVARDRGGGRGTARGTGGDDAGVCEDDRADGADAGDGDGGPAAGGAGGGPAFGGDGGAVRDACG